MNKEKIKRAYDFLIDKYPTTPNINPALIKHEIQVKFNLEEKELYIAYYSWKRNVTDIEDIPKFKDVVICDKSTITCIPWSKRIDKLKKIYERYIDGEEISILANDNMTSAESLMTTFALYKKKGILKSEKRIKNYMILSGKKIYKKELEEIIKRIDNGEKTVHIAKELGVGRKRLSNACNYYRKEFINKR